MNQRSILAAALVFLCAAITLRAAPTLSANHNTVNAILGDVSFVKRFGKAPTEATNERLRIQTHLEYVENLLRKADVAHLSPQLRERRARMLALLHEYRLAGAFPVNLDFPNERRPCFIDAAGNICAVGYLIEQTAGRALAERITAAHKYDFLAAMALPELTAWVAASGLTARECGMIQPAYAYLDMRMQIAKMIPEIIVATSATLNVTLYIAGIPDACWANSMPCGNIYGTLGTHLVSLTLLESTFSVIRAYSRDGIVRLSIPPGLISSAGTYTLTYYWSSSSITGYYNSKIFTVNAPTSVRDLTLPSPITLSPNPAQESITLALPENELHRVRVMNTLGSQVSALSDAAGATALDVSGLAAGVYFVEVESQKTRRRTVQKVVKY